jgi:hypothetical protein
MCANNADSSPWGGSVGWNELRHKLDDQGCTAHQLEQLWQGSVVFSREDGFWTKTELRKNDRQRAHA